MKTKFIFAVVFIFSVQIVNAQTWGLKGGVNFANVTIKMNGASASPKSLTGFHFGIIGDFNLKENLYFNTGLFYTQKGFSGEAGSEVGNIKETANYLEIPLNIAYKIPIKDKTKFFFQAGPYIAYGIGVKQEAGGESQSGSFSDAGLKKFDYGLGVGGGMEFGVLVASINYQIGLADINDAHDVADAGMKHKVLQISLAYMFSKKK